MNSLNSKKGRNVILVTAAQGGSGRTMTAVALATFLTQYGTVAFIGNE
jgi:Mrp family chromosome partitioning ATPase